MGQNLALNIAHKGFHISVYSHSNLEVNETLKLAKKGGNISLHGFSDPETFVKSLQKPSIVIVLVSLGVTVDEIIDTFFGYLERGDCIVDGCNEWIDFTKRREEAMAIKVFHYLGI